MPILDETYVSSLYYASIPNFNGDNVQLLLKFYSESMIQTVDSKVLIQGDIGIHVLDVGGTHWESQLSAPHFVFVSSGVPIINLLDVVIYGFNNGFVISPSTSDISTIMRRASISIGSEGIRTDIQCLSDKGSINDWLNLGVNAPSRTFNARLAKSFDTMLSFDATTLGLDAFPEYAYIQSANININVNTAEKFYIPDDLEGDTKSSYPEFIINNYLIDGEIEFVYPAISPASFVSIDSSFHYPQGSMFKLNFGNTIFDLSYTKIVCSEVSKTIDENSTVVKLNFKSYS